MGDNYSTNRSEGLGESYERGLRAEQIRLYKGPAEPQSRIVDGFDLSDPIDFAFWNIAMQIKKENEIKEQSRD